jgi:hypothetical protein
MENINWMEKPSNSNMVAKIGASVMMFLLVCVTGVVPGVFMLVFMHHTFMTGYYLLENVMVAIQRIDQGAKRVNNDYLKDGQLAVAAEEFLSPHVENAVNQLINLGKEMKSPKSEEAEVKTEEAPKESKVEETPKADVKAEEAKAEKVSIEDTVLNFVKDNKDSILSEIAKGGDAFTVIGENLIKSAGLSSEQLQELMVLSADESRLNSLGEKVSECLQGVNTNIPKEGEMYKTHKWSIEQAIAKGDVTQLKRFSKMENVMKFGDLAKLITDAIPKEEKAKEKVERKYF